MARGKLLAGCGTHCGAVECRMQCRTGPGGGHTQILNTVAAVWESMMVWSVLNLTNMEGYGDGVAHFMNSYITRAQLLEIAKMNGMYHGTAV